MSTEFQSQTRSRSTCDSLSTCEYVGDNSFQSKTRSRSTCDAAFHLYQVYSPQVSISDEKPLHMRHATLGAMEQAQGGFNLRREAAPHATYRGSWYGLPWT